MSTKTIFAAAIVTLVALYLTGDAQEQPPGPDRAQAQDNRDPNQVVRDDVNSELVDVGRAIGRMNQSYVIAPVIGHNAATGGSYYIDTIDDPNARENGEPGNRVNGRGDRLPAPVFVTPDGEYELPAWLYGEVPVQQRPRGEPSEGGEGGIQPAPQNGGAAANRQSRATPKVYQTEIYNRGRRSVRTFRSLD